MSLRFLLSHAMGNANVRQALTALHEHDLLAEFWTTIRWNPESAVNAILPGRVRAELNRRSYPQVPRHLVHTRPWREVGRLLALRAGRGQLTRRNESYLSVANVCYALDRAAAKRIEGGGIDAVYAYEDGALETFRAARRQGINTVYELPTAHWKYKRELLSEETELCPGWADTITCGQDSERKDRPEGCGAGVSRSDPGALPLLDRDIAGVNPPWKAHSGVSLRSAAGCHPPPGSAAFQATRTVCGRADPG